MAEKTRCEDCDRTFKDLDGLMSHNNAKHPERLPKEKKPINLERYKGWFIFLVILGGIIGLIIWGVSGVETLPPTTMQGHVESMPPTHATREPMGDLEQRHMLEHSDGGGLPGRIINYNCKDYKCEDGLIEKLEAFAEKYPTNVYVTPYEGMDAKIALTKLGKIEVLEEYNEEKIEKFIKT